jgi:hypothetical protein
MKFHEAMADHGVEAIRRPIWAHKGDHLRLPPIINGKRGPWCHLVTITPIFEGGEFNRYELKEHPILWIEFKDDPTEYEIFTPPSEGGES